jgi:regulator of cell morphogenesis and NO signaling
MTMLDTHAPVGRLVADRPARSRVFERFGIDYCCGGKVPLDLACERHGVDLDSVRRELDACDAAGLESDHGDWSRRATGELIDHIVDVHHAYLRRELPRLMALADRVAEAHGARHPEMVEVRRVLGPLREELLAHPIKVERILFPMLRRWEAGELSAAELSFLAGPIGVMEAEHDDAGVALAALRGLTRGYMAPDDACNTFRALVDGLAELEADLHRHVHEENNILFPRALSSVAGMD